MVHRVTDEERAADRRRLAAGLVLLVGVSAVLTAAYGGATPLELALVGAAGLLAGGVLAAVLGGWG